MSTKAASIREDDEHVNEDKMDSDIGKEEDSKSGMDVNDEAEAKRVLKVRNIIEDDENDTANNSNEDDKKDATNDHNVDEGDQDLGSDEEYVQLTEVHEREYHSYSLEHNVCFTPADEIMEEFLGDQHRLLKFLLRGELIFPSIRRLDRVIDLGYGAANWAVEVAAQHPNAEVEGLDICGYLLPNYIPPNFFYDQRNLNEGSGLGRDNYDLVQARFVADGINRTRWSTFVNEIGVGLKPGGWCQFVEYFNVVQSANGSLTENHALRRWSKMYLSSVDEMKNPRIALVLRAELAKAGFVHIRTRMVAVPLSPWLRHSPLYKKAGERMQILIDEHMRSLGLLPITRHTGMSLEEFDQLIDEAVEEAKNQSFQAYLPLNICIAQKPEQGWVARMKGLPPRPKKTKDWPWNRAPEHPDLVIQHMYDQRNPPDQA